MYFWSLLTIKNIESLFVRSLFVCSLSIYLSFDHSFCILNRLYLYSLVTLAVFFWLSSLVSVVYRYFYFFRNEEKLQTFERWWHITACARLCAWTALYTPTNNNSIQLIYCNAAPTIAFVQAVQAFHGHRLQSQRMPFLNKKCNSFRRSKDIKIYISWTHRAGRGDNYFFAVLSKFSTSKFQYVLCIYHAITWRRL